MKEIWDSTKKNAWTWLFMIIFGFGLGKLFTYNSIVIDCKVLSMFRVGDIAFDCRMSKAPVL